MFDGDQDALGQMRVHRFAKQKRPKCAFHNQLFPDTQTSLSNRLHMHDSHHGRFVGIIVRGCDDFAKSSGDDIGSRLRGRCESIWGKGKKKPGILNARQVYQGGFTSGRRRTPLGALGMPGREPGKDRNSVREKTLYHAAVCTAVVRGAR